MIAVQSNAARARNDGVDALRAILIYSVMAYHYLVYWAPPFSPQNFYGHDGAYPEWIGIGSFGVHVFFLVSGYVITLTIGSSKSAFDFLYRRFSRIFPALIVCCVLTAIIGSLLGAEIADITPWNVLASLTLHPEKLHGTFIDGSYWSLGVEIRFYLWVALFFAVLRKNFWIGVVVLGVLAIIQDIFSLHFTDYYLIGKYIGLFLLGMSFKYFENENTKVAAWVTLLVGAVWFIARSHNFNIHNAYWAWSNVYIISGCALLFVMTNTSWLSGVSFGYLPYLGRVSYCLYLLHQTIGVAIIAKLHKVFGAPDVLAVAVAFGVTQLLAIGMYHFVETPAQKALRGWKFKNPWAVAKAVA